MSYNSPNIGLPYLLASQSQKHVTFNDLVNKIDAVLMMSVISNIITEPPALPSEGDRYIVPENALGIWQGQSGNIAIYQNLGWFYITPKNGFIITLQNESKLYYYNNGWFDVSTTITHPSEFSQIGVGTNADKSNPLSVKLNNALFTAKYASEDGDGNIRLKLNKEETDKTSSFIFQNNWSGKTEFGLIGNDNFGIKVSSNGSEWDEALIIDNSTGYVSPKALEQRDSGNLMYCFMPSATTDTSELYRINVACENAPRNAVISAISGANITLSAEVARCFHDPSMAYTKIRIWNISKSPAASAWITNAPDSYNLTVSDDTDITSWENGETIQIGDYGIIGELNVITCDIGALLENKFGTAFRQKGIILSGQIVGGSSGDMIRYSPTGLSGSAAGIMGYGETNPPGIFPCTDLSPISNSNLIRIIESFSASPTNRLVRMGGVFA